MYKPAFRLLLFIFALITECTFLFYTFQDLPAEAVEDDLVETRQQDEILQKPCPNEYSKLKEEEVKS